VPNAARSSTRLSSLATQQDIIGFVSTERPSDNGAARVLICAVVRKMAEFVAHWDVAFEAAAGGRV